MFRNRRALGAARQEAASWKGEALALQSALDGLLEAVDHLPSRVEVRLSTEARALANSGHPIGVRYNALQAPDFLDAVNAARLAASGADR